MNTEIAPSSNASEPRDGLFSRLHADALAHFSSPPSRGRIGLMVGVALTSAGFRCVAIHRVGHAARRRLGTIGKMISRFLFWHNRHWYGCAIASTADLGGGLILPHPQNIIIGAQAVVGPRAWIFHNVTIGGAPGQVGMACVGSDARLYAGAVLTGPITIGDRVVVGANAVVNHDVPSDSIVRGAVMSVSSTIAEASSEQPVE